MKTRQALQIRHLGLCEYESVWRDMQHFTAERHAETVDELWLLEHPPVFTVGLNGKPQHLLNTADIPVIQVDRGGQVTYHGPGQLVVYCLLDLQRLGTGVQQLVRQIEQAVINLLASYGIESAARRDAPGVYVNGAKIAALGLRIKHNCCYHGLSFNLDMDLQPFSRINPCGYEGMPVTQLSDLVDNVDHTRVAEQLLTELKNILGYNKH